MKQGSEIEENDKTQCLAACSVPVNVSLEKSSSSSVFQSAFVSQVVGTYGTQILGVLIGLGTTAIVARVLGPAGRGEYAVAMAIGLLGVQMCNLGLHASNTFLVAKRPYVLGALLTNSMIVSFGVGGLVALCCWILFFLKPGLAPVHGNLLALSLIWVPVGLACLLAQNLLMGIQRVSAYNFIELTRRMLGLLLVFAAILLGRRTPGWLLFAVLMGMAGTLLLCLGELRKSIRFVWQPSLELFRDGIGMGLRAYLAAFFAFLVIRSDLLLVQYLRGPRDAGYYSIAGSLADYMMLLPVAIATVVFPKLSSMPCGRRTWHWFRKIILNTCWLLIPVLVLTAMLAHPIIHVLFGDAFQPAASALMLLMPGVFFLGIETVMVQYLNSLGFPVSVVWAWFLTCLLNIGVNFWAIPRYGIAGASLVSSICYLTMFLLVWLIIWKRKMSNEPVIALRPEESIRAAD